MRRSDPEHWIWVWMCATLTLVASLLVLCAARAEDSRIAYVAVEADSSLNVRDAPDGHRLGRLFRGDPVTVIGTDRDWSRVLAPIEDNEGWVRSCYLTDTPPGEDTEPAAYVNASGGRARVRECPGGRLIRWLKAGAGVTVTSWTTDNDGQRWAYGGDGYISGDCLKEGTSDENQPAGD